MTTFAEEKLIRQQTNVDDLNAYISLDNRADKLVAAAETWLTDGTALHGKLTDADKKGEVIALRQSLIVRLKAALSL